MPAAEDAQQLTEALWNEPLRPLGVTALTIAVVEPGHARPPGRYAEHEQPWSGTPWPTRCG